MFEVYSLSSKYMIDIFRAVDGTLTALGRKRRASLTIGQLQEAYRDAFSDKCLDCLDDNRPCEVHELISPYSALVN